MSDEELQRLRELLRRQGRKLHGHDALLLALLATHPNPGQLLEKLRLYQLGMEANYLASPNLPDTARELATEEIGKWIEAIEGRIRSEEPPGT